MNFDECYYIQINEQLTEKQSSMEQRYAEIETGNNHLMEEMVCFNFS